MAFLALPWCLRAFVVLRSNYRDPISMAPANVLTIRIHNLTGILLVVAYLAQAAVLGRSPSRMVIPLAVLLVLYLPVVVVQLVPRGREAGEAG